METQKRIRKSFLVHTSWENSIKLLSVEEKATLLMNLFKYHNDEQLLEMSDMLKIFWTSIEWDLENNMRKYDAKLERALKKKY
jgi:hypothetical protein